MKKLSDMIKIADNVYRANATSKSFYIVVNGTPKFCIQERYEKLLAAAGGDHAKLVNGYKSRGSNAAPNVQNDTVPTPVADTSDVVLDSTATSESDIKIGVETSEAVPA